VFQRCWQSQQFIHGPSRFLPPVPKFLTHIRHRRAYDHPSVAYIPSLRRMMNSVDFHSMRTHQAKIKAFAIRRVTPEYVAGPTNADLPFGSVAQQLHHCP